MKILLTGTAGFIASRVAHRLLDRGDEVVGIDLMNDAYDPRLKYWRNAIHSRYFILTPAGGIGGNWDSHSP